MARNGNQTNSTHSNAPLVEGMRGSEETTRRKMLTSKEHSEKLEVRVCEHSDVVFGTGAPVIIAGPCCVESKEQILEIAEAVKTAGASVLRGGAYKPRTAPYDFDGYGERALEWLANAREATGLPVDTEAIDESSLELVVQYADIIHIGTRNAQNYSLLKAAGRERKPVLLKRGMWQTIEEWLMSAEHIMAEGNHDVILCERGIRTFGNHTRFTLDIGAIAVAKELSRLPVIADPSHAAGDVKYVPALAKAALAAGADGLIIEVHNNPEKAMTDKKQQLDLKQFSDLMKELKGSLLPRN